MKIRFEYIKITLLSFLLVFGLFSGILWDANNVSATSIFPIDKSQQNIKNDGKILVFKEGKDTTSVVKDIKRVDKQAKIVVLDSISILTVYPSNKKKSEEIGKLVQNKYYNIVETVGEEQTVAIDDPQLVHPSPLMYNKWTLSAITKNKEAHRESIYAPWTWDIKAVTENGASFKIETGNHDIKVGVIDSGIDFNHPDLKENIISKGRSFVDGINDTQDYMGHGTMVAGSIAADGNLKGIAPNVGIVPYKVFHTGDADSTKVIQAIIAAANDDMDVINLSLGTYKSVKNKNEKAVYKAYKRAVKYAVKKNTFVVASSGTELVGLDISNPRKLAQARGYENDKQYHMPGGMKKVYTVAGTTKNNVLASYSNYGKNVSIGSPGGDYGPRAEEGILDVRYMTLTTYPTNLPQSVTSKYAGFEKGYEFMIGTSLAVPKVTATAALIIAQYQEKHGKKPKIKYIKRILNKGATKVPSKHKFGAGIVNAYKSLNVVK